MGATVSVGSEPALDIVTHAHTRASSLSRCPAGYAVTVVMLAAILEHDRTRAGWSVEQAARRLGVSAREYRAIEAGERTPAWETWDQICKLFGWQQTFVGPR